MVELTVLRMESLELRWYFLKMKVIMQYGVFVSFYESFKANHIYYYKVISKNKSRTKPKYYLWPLRAKKDLSLNI